jgi:hypothetical protein
MTVLAPVVVGRSLDPSSKSLMMGICIQRVLWVLWRLVKSFILGIDSIAGVPIRGGRLLVLQVLWVRRIPEIANPPLIVVRVLASEVTLMIIYRRVRSGIRRTMLKKRTRTRFTNEHSPADARADPPVDYHECHLVPGRWAAGVVRTRAAGPRFDHQAREEKVPSRPDQSPRCEHHESVHHLQAGTMDQVPPANPEDYV